jgi:hypothetical protein
MRVRYFPHTHISGALADVLNRLFDEVAVITASKDDGVPEGITTLGPSPEEVQRLDVLLASWRHFGGLHQGELSTYALGHRVEPLDDLLTSQIKGELQRQVEGRPAHEEGGDAALSARALLSLAAEYDLRSRDLEQDLAAIDKKQQDLLDALKGEVSDLPELPVFTEQPGEVKMLRRLSAWATLFVGEGDPLGDRVFVTTSREALELVGEYGSPLEELGVFEGDRLSGELLGTLLAGTAHGLPVGEGAVGGDGPVTVRIFITGSEHPYNVFNGFIRGVNVCPVECQGKSSDIKGNILFVLLEGVGQG